MKIAPKPSVASLVRFPHEKSDRHGMVRLDRNERAVPFPEKVWSRFQELLTQEMVLAYPQTAELFQAIANYVGVDEDRIGLASGSDIAIRSVYEAYISKGDRVVVPDPCYAMYKVYGELFEAETVEVPIEDDLELDPERVLDALTPGTRAVVIEFPGGFAGTSMAIEDVLRVVAQAREIGALAIVDEAYSAFNGYTLVPYVDEYENLIVTRSCSKDLGAAGLRVGYTVACREVTDILRRVRPMHEVTSASACFIRAALESPELIDDYVETIRANIRYTRDALAQLGYRTAGGTGNFIVVKFDDNESVKTVIARLQEKSILVRRPFESGRMKGWMRVGIGTKQQMSEFVDALATVVSG
ncbi:pyridoxal phosphate-dependent aminotransferase [Nisaea sediminum]|uniref:pyridoxal phosphate-dependent aminotransferase n=1 Tax=Nisaea sediminum TaxID=2775867 RepID=UPI00186693B7|nr:histidinol-phosphate transaminase [Nisaea sediminum]